MCIYIIQCMYSRVLCLFSKEHNMCILFRKYIGQIWTDSLVHDEKALKYLVDVIGQVCTCILQCIDALSGKYPDYNVYGIISHKISPTLYLGLLYFSCYHCSNQFLQDRVMLGSDYPFPLGEHHPGKLIESVEELDDELKVKFTLRNAL